MTYDMHRRRDFNIAVRPPQKEHHRPATPPQTRPNRPQIHPDRPSVIIVVRLFHRQGRTDRRRIRITSMMGALHDVDRTHRLIKTVMKIGVLLHPAGDVRRGNGKKEKDSDRSGGSNKSNSKERTAVRMRTV